MAGEANIALVDDDRNILTSVQIALEAEGFDVTTYTDGQQALQQFAKTSPDLVVLDIKMPRMDGMEVLRQLRSKSDLPVIFLTSKDEEIDEVLGLRMGADDYIRKPFSQRLLIERIRAILRRRMADEAPRSDDCLLTGDDEERIGSCTPHQCACLSRHPSHALVPASCLCPLLSYPLFGVDTLLCFTCLS